MSGESDIPFDDKNIDEANSGNPVKQDLKCTDCGGNLRYIEPYDRFWCDKCAKYMEIGFGKELETAILEEITEVVPEETPLQEEIEVTEKKFKCPVCNYDLQYFEEYERYWCDMCAEYMPENFGKSEKSDYNENHAVNEIQDEAEVPHTTINAVTEEEENLIADQDDQNETADESRCPNCGSSLRFIEEYGKMWCDKCLEYITDKAKPDISSEIYSVETGKKAEVSCPACGTKLRIIEEYGRYWCDKCLEYVSLDTVEEEPQDIAEKIVLEAVEEPESEETEFSTESPIMEEPLQSEYQQEESQYSSQQISMTDNAIATDQYEKEQSQDIEESVLTEIETGPEDELRVFCPKCRQEVRYIVQYDRFWCDSCGEYMPPGFKGVGIAVTEEVQEEVTTPVSVDEISPVLNEQVIDDKTAGIIEEEPVSPFSVEEIPIEDIPEEEHPGSLDKTKEADLDLADEKEKVETLDLEEKISVVGAGETEGVVLVCQKCSKKTRYIEQYDRYWCDSCGEYMPVGFGKKGGPSEEPVMSIAELEDEVVIDEPQKAVIGTVKEQVKETPHQKERLSCPDCSGKVRFIEQYQRYWCDNCEKYMPLNFGLEQVNVVPPSTDLFEGVKEKEQVFTCPKCGSVPRYVEKYKRYWCENCSEYIQPIYDREPPLDKSFISACPDCGKQLVKCEPCKHFWCSECDKCYPKSMFR